MSKSGFQTRRNVMAISSISFFSGVKGGFRAGCRDVYFIRFIGCGDSYLKEIRDMDRQWKEWQGRGQGCYLRLREMPKLRSREQASRYAMLVEKWQKTPEEGILLEGAMENGIFRFVFSEALSEVREMFRKYMPSVSETMEQNFLAKLLFWAESMVNPFWKSWEERAGRKFVFSGTVKLQEYLFCYFLSLLGTDVMLLLPDGDAELPEELKMLSTAVKLGAERTADIPPYGTEEKQQEKPEPQAASCVVHIERADRRTKRSETAAKNIPPVRQEPASRKNTAEEGQERRELEFEELAMLASSVVMIAVHDPDGEVVCTGSGIMIGKGGYILTNHHVVGKGVFYSVRIEDDETIYETDELIKYNHFQDLAVIRIDKELKPIPLYKGGKPLVRGQKVVAIGSPLGLFNSVSNGIISGFRKIGEVDMIQFTAPISSGSSGGAVLNMQGEVIGISTAGYESGQNINLAVEYRMIEAFARGFL